MTELSQKILADYQVRKTKKQKTAFIDFMQREIPDLQVEEGGSPKSRNLVLGDVKNARVVLGAHYDTCAVLPFPNFLMPKNIPVSLLYSILIAVPFIAVLFLVSFLITRLTQDPLLTYIATLAVYFALYFGLLFGGVPNKHTVNDNTSGVILLCELIAICKEKNMTDVAFVFFDHEECGLLGSAYFRKRHKKEMKGKLLINFDCVSDGDHMLFVLNKPAKARYGDHLKTSFPKTDVKIPYFEKSSTTMYPSDQMGFHTAIAVSAMKKIRGLGLYLDRIHTKKDTVMDERNIAYLCEGMERFFETISSENT